MTGRQRFSSYVLRPVVPILLSDPALRQRCERGKRRVVVGRITEDMPPLADRNSDDNFLDALIEQFNVSVQRLGHVPEQLLRDVQDSNDAIGMFGDSDFLDMIVSSYDAAGPTSQEEFDQAKQRATQEGTVDGKFVVDVELVLKICREQGIEDDLKDSIMQSASSDRKLRLSLTLTYGAFITQLRKTSSFVRAGDASRKVASLKAPQINLSGALQSIVDESSEYLSTTSQAAQVIKRELSNLEQFPYPAFLAMFEIITNSIESSASMTVAKPDDYGANDAIVMFENRAKQTSEWSRFRLMKEAFSASEVEVRKRAVEGIAQGNTALANVDLKDQTVQTLLYDPKTAYKLICFLEEALIKKISASALQAYARTAGAGSTLGQAGPSMLGAGNAAPNLSVAMSIPVPGTFTPAQSSYAADQPFVATETVDKAIDKPRRKSGVRTVNFEKIAHQVKSAKQGVATLLATIERTVGLMATLSDRIDFTRTECTPEETQLFTRFAEEIETVHVSKRTQKTFDKKIDLYREMDARRKVAINYIDSQPSILATSCKNYSQRSATDPATGVQALQQLKVGEFDQGLTELHAASATFSQTIDAVQQKIALGKSEQAAALKAKKELDRMHHIREREEKREQERTIRSETSKSNKRMKDLLSRPILPKKQQPRYKTLWASLNSTLTTLYTDSAKINTAISQEIDICGMVGSIQDMNKGLLAINDSVALISSRAQMTKKLSRDVVALQTLVFDSIINGMWTASLEYVAHDLWTKRATDQVLDADDELLLQVLSENSSTNMQFAEFAANGTGITLKTPAPAANDGASKPAADDEDHVMAKLKDAERAVIESEQALSTLGEQLKQRRQQLGSSSQASAWLVSAIVEPLRKYRQFDWIFDEHHQQAMIVNGHEAACSAVLSISTIPPSTMLEHALGPLMDVEEFIGSSMLGFMDPADSRNAMTVLDAVQTATQQRLSMIRDTVDALVRNCQALVSSIVREAIDNLLVRARQSMSDYRVEEMSRNYVERFNAMGVPPTHVVPVQAFCRELDKALRMHRADPNLRRMSPDQLFPPDFATRRYTLAQDDIFGYISDVHSIGSLCDSVLAQLRITYIGMEMQSQQGVAASASISATGASMIDQASSLHAERSQRRQELHSLRQRLDVILSVAREFVAEKSDGASPSATPMPIPDWPLPTFSSTDLAKDDEYTLYMHLVQKYNWITPYSHFKDGEAIRQFVKRAYEAIVESEDAMSSTGVVDVAKATQIENALIDASRRPSPWARQRSFEEVIALVESQCQKMASVAGISVLETGAGASGSMDDTRVVSSAALVTNSGPDGVSLCDTSAPIAKSIKSALFELQKITNRLMLYAVYDVPASQSYSFTEHQLMTFVSYFALGTGLQPNIDVNTALKKYAGNASQDLNEYESSKRMLPLTSSDKPVLLRTLLPRYGKSIYELIANINLQMFTSPESGGGEIFQMCANALHNSIVCANGIRLNRVRIESAVRFRSVDACMDACERSLELFQRCSVLVNYIMDVCVQLNATLQQATTLDAGNGTRLGDVSVVDYSKSTQEARQGTTNMRQALENTNQRLRGRRTQAQRLSEGTASKEDIRREFANLEKLLVDMTNMVHLKSSTSKFLSSPARQEADRLFAERPIVQRSDCEDALPSQASSLLSAALASTGGGDEAIEQQDDAFLFDEWGQVDQEATEHYVREAMNLLGVTYSNKDDDPINSIVDLEKRRVQLVKMELSMNDGGPLAAWTTLLRTTSTMLNDGMIASSLNMLMIAAQSMSNLHTMLALLDAATAGTAASRFADTMNEIFSRESYNTDVLGMATNRYSFDLRVGSVGGIDPSASDDASDAQSDAMEDFTPTVIQSYATAAALLVPTNYLYEYDELAAQAEPLTVTLEDTMGIPPAFISAYGRIVYNDIASVSRNLDGFQADHPLEFAKIKQFLIENWPEVANDSSNDNIQHTLSTLEQSKTFNLAVSVQKTLPYSDMRVRLEHEMFTIAVTAAMQKEDVLEDLVEEEHEQARQFIDASTSSESFGGNLWRARRAGTPSTLSTINHVPGGRKRKAPVRRIEGEVSMRDGDGSAFSMQSAGPTLILASEVGGVAAVNGLVMDPPTDPDENAKRVRSMEATTEPETVEMYDEEDGEGEEDEAQAPLDYRTDLYEFIGSGTSASSSLVSTISYFNLADGVLSGNETFNKLARVCRPMHSPYVEGCLHAECLEEAIQTLFMYCYALQESRFRTEPVDDVVVDAEGGRNDDGDEQSGSLEAYNVRKDLDFPVLEDDEATTESEVTSKISVIYNRGNTNRNDRDRETLFKLFSPHNRREMLRRELGVDSRDGVLPSERLSTRSPVRFAIPIPNLPGRLAVVTLSALALPIFESDMLSSMDSRTNSFVVDVGIVQTTVDLTEAAPGSPPTYAQIVREMMRSKDTFASIHFPALDGWPMAATTIGVASSSDGAPSNLVQQAEVVSGPSPAIHFRGISTVVSQPPMNIGMTSVLTMVASQREQLLGALGSDHILTNATVNMPELANAFSSFIKKNASMFKDGFEVRRPTVLQMNTHPDVVVLREQHEPYPWYLPAAPTGCSFSAVPEGKVDAKVDESIGALTMTMTTTDASRAESDITQSFTNALLKYAFERSPRGPEINAGVVAAFLIRNPITEKSQGPFPRVLHPVGVLNAAMYRNAATSTAGFALASRLGGAMTMGFNSERIKKLVAPTTRNKLTALRLQNGLVGKYTAVHL